MGGDVPAVNETTVNTRFITSALEMLICDNETSVCIATSIFHLELFMQGERIKMPKKRLNWANSKILCNN